MHRGAVTGEAVSGKGCTDSVSAEARDPSARPPLVHRKCGLSSDPSQVALEAWNTVRTTERKLPGPWVRPLVGKAARKHAGQGARGDTCVETNGAGEG